MSWLLHACASNAALAALLAVLAWIVSRRRRPALAHALWLLVLLKLVTPPLVPVRVLPWFSESEPSRPIQVAVVEPIWEPEPVPPPRNPPTLVRVRSVSQASADERKRSAEEMAILMGKLIPPEMRAIMPPIPPPQPLAEPDSVVEDTPEEPEAIAAPMPEPLPQRSPKSSPPVNAAFHGTNMLAGVWLAGSVVWLAVAVRRVAKFRRWLRYAEPAPASLEAEVGCLARRMGLSRGPAMKLVPGPLPPLIWAAATQATLYFPSDLLTRLDPKKRETLLVHELAHLVRRDHWVRWLEILTLALYWWLPIAWLARRQLQRAEEVCCDACVLQTLPGSARTYAEALLDAVDFVAGAPPLPAVASGLTPAQCIKRRLLMILHGTPSPRLPVAARLALLLTALGLLPLLAAPQEKIAAPTGSSVVIAEPAKPVAKTDEEPFLFEQRPTVLQSASPRWWSFALSNDGKLLAVTAGNHEQTGEIIVFDYPAGTVKTTIKHATGIRCAAFSPDNKTLAAGSFDNSVRFYDVATWRLKALGVGHTGAINSIAFTTDGKRLVTGALDNKVKVWAVPNIPAPVEDKAKPADDKAKPAGDKSKTDDKAKADGKPKPADDKAKADDKTKAFEFKPYASLEEHTNWVLSIAVSTDGKTIVSGGRDNLARVWDMPEPAKDGNPVTMKKARQTLTGHTSAVETVALTSDGTIIATGSWDASARLWDAKDGKIRQEFGGHPSGVNGLAFSKDGKEVGIAIGNSGTEQGGQVHRYAVEDGKKRGVTQHRLTCRCVGYSPNGEELLSLGEERAVLRVSLKTNMTTATIAPPAAAPAVAPQIVLAVAYSPDGKRMAVGGENKQITLYNLADKQARAWPAHDDVIHALIFGSDGKTLISGSYDKTVKIWDLTDGKSGSTPAVRVLKGHANWVLSLAISRDGTKLASAGYDKTVRLWDLGAWKSGDAPPVKLLKAHMASVLSVVFSPDGTLLASGSADRTTRIWNVAKGEQLGILRGHKGAVRAIAFDPEGKTLASGSEDKTVKLWDLTTEKDGSITGKDRAELGEHGDMIGALAFSPKGRTLAVGTWIGQVYLWDPHLAKRRTVLNGHNDAIAALVFAPDGQQLASGSYDKSVRLWPPMPAPAPGILSYSAHTDAVWSIALSKDGKWAATGSRDGAVRIYERGEAKPRFVAEKAHPGGVTFVLYSPDSQTLVSAGKDKVVRVWKATGEKVREFPGHTDEILKATFHPEGKLLATAGADKDIRIWDLASPIGPIRPMSPIGAGPIKTLSGHTEAVHGLAFSPDGKLLASAGMDRSWRLWDAQKWETKHTSGPVPNNGFILALDFAPDGKTLALAHSQDQEIGPDGDLIRQQFRNIMFIETETGKPKAGSAPNPTPNFNNFGGGAYFHPDWITGLVYSTDGKTIITASRDMNIRFWTVANGQISRQFRAHNAGIAQLVVGPEDGMIATAGEDRVATLWSVVLGTQSPRAMLTGHSGQIWFAELSKNGQYLATGGTDKRVQLRDNFQGSQPFTFDGTYQAVYSVAVSPDGKRIASGHGDGKIEIWDADTGKRVKTLAGHTMRVWSLAFTADNKQLFSCSGDWDAKEKPGEVKLWNLDDGKVVREFPGHTALVYNLVLSPDAKTLATASHDKTVRLWDVATAKPKHTLTHPNPVRSVCFAPDGLTLVSGCNGELVLTDNTKPDGMMVFWDVAEGKEKSRFPMPNNMQINRAKYSPDGKTIAIVGNVPRPAAVPPGAGTGDAAVAPPAVQQPAGPGGRLLFWDVEKAVVRKEAAPLLPEMILDVAYANHGYTVVTVGGIYGQVGNVRFYDAIYGGRVAEFYGHKLWCEAVAFLNDGRVVSGGGIKDRDGELKIWGAKGVRPLRALDGPNPVHAAAFRPDMKELATGDGQGDIYLWDISVWPPTGEVQKRLLKEHKALVRGIAYVPDGKTLISAADGGWVVFWDVEKGTKKKVFEVTKKHIYGISLSPDGKFLVVAGGDYQQTVPGEVTVWNTTTYEQVATLPGHARHAWSAAFSPNGKWLVTAGGERTVKIWDTATWKEIRSLPVQNGVRAIAISPDGKLLATSGETDADNVIRIWETDTWRERAAFQGHTMLVFHLKFSSDSKTLYSTSSDQSVKVWDMPGPVVKPATVAGK